MFLRSSSRPQPVECFFCLSTTLLPPGKSAPVDSKGKGKATGVGEVGSKWNWHCERCGCWNVRDERGEMVSELPAMRTPTMNQESFSLRAKPSSSHLPTAPGASPFCHICLTNQMLIMNMLANYLPDEADPSYRELYDDLPNYLASVHARFPPVCSNCQPAVDEALKRADRRANVDAWGSALRRSHASTGNGGSRWAEMLDVAFWRLRGVMFCCHAALSLGLGLSSAVYPRYADSLWRSSWPGITTPVLLLLLQVLSITWIAWDPYWLRRKRNRSYVRVTGRRAWLLDMAFIYCVRLASSVWTVWENDGERDNVRVAHIVSSGLEVMALLHALTSLRLSGPVTVRPLAPVTISSAPASPGDKHAYHVTTPRNDDPRLDATPSANPMFGQASFRPKSNDATGHGKDKDDCMDWEPSPAPVGGRPRRPPGLDDRDYDSYLDTPSKHDWDRFAVNRQRMFPTHSDRDETGLESLIAGWGIGGARVNEAINAAQSTHGTGTVTSPPNLAMVTSTIVRLTSCFLAVVRLISLAFVMYSHAPQDRISMIDTISSSVEIGVILMSFTLPPRSPPQIRITFLVVELLMRYIYLFGRQRQFGSLGKILFNPWTLALTWSQWAMMNLTRAML